MAIKRKYTRRGKVDSLELEELKDKLKTIHAAVIVNEGMDSEILKSIHVKLDRTIEQTTRINGTVAKVVAELDQAKEKIHALELADANHTANCPQTPRVEKLEDHVVDKLEKFGEKIERLDAKMLSVKFYEKNPYLLYLNIAAVVVVVIAGVVVFFKSLLS